MFGMVKSPMRKPAIEHHRPGNFRCAGRTIFNFMAVHAARVERTGSSAYGPNLRLGSGYGCAEERALLQILSGDHECLEFLELLLHECFLFRSFHDARSGCVV